MIGVNLTLFDVIELHKTGRKETDVMSFTKTKIP